MLAWKWERMGAAIALVAIVICAVVNWKVLIFPGTLIPITALLYSFSAKPIGNIKTKNHGSSRFA